MRNYILWVSLALIWSASFAAIKIGIETMGPLTLVAGRMIVASVFLLLVLKSKSLRLPVEGASVLAFLISGLLGNVIPFSLISYGENTVESGLAALLMGTAPVATVLLAPLMLEDERLTIKALVGIGVGISGLVVLVGTSVIDGLGDHVFGQLSIIGAALCYAATTLYVRRFVKLQALVMATGSILVGAVAISVAALVVEQPFSSDLPSINSLFALAYLGIMSTAVATLIYFYLVPRMGASRMSQINFLVPVFGTLIGIGFMGEPFRAEVIVALALVLIAISLVIRPHRD